MCQPLVVLASCSGSIQAYTALRMAVASASTAAVKCMPAPIVQLADGHTNVSSTKLCLLAKLWGDFAADALLLLQAHAALRHARSDLGAKLAAGKAASGGKIYSAAVALHIAAHGTAALAKYEVPNAQPVAKGSNPTPGLSQSALPASTSGYHQPEASTTSHDKYARYLYHAACA